MANDPILKLLIDQGVKLVKRNADLPVPTHVYFDPARRPLSPHPDGKPFISDDDPITVSNDPDPAVASWVWACRFAGACNFYVRSSSFSGLWYQRELYMQYKWERGLVEPYDYDLGRTYRGVGLLFDNQRVLRGGILHHRQDRFPPADSAEPLFRGETVCSICFLGRQRVIAKSKALDPPGRIRLFSATATAMRVLEARLHVNGDSVTVSIHVLKTVAIDGITNEEWKQLVYLMTHEDIGPSYDEGGESLERLPLRIDKMRAGDRGTSKAGRVRFSGETDSSDGSVSG